MRNLLSSRPNVRPHAELDLSGASFCHALGPAGAPATLTFIHDAVIVTTPTGSIRVEARTIATAAPGVYTAGLRPNDGDVLRRATHGSELPVRLVADALTLTLVHAGITVTTGRW